MPTWLVTGGSGFLGRHVLASLDRDEPVFAAGRRCPDHLASNRFVPCDLEQPSEIEAALAAARPDLIIHAAGRTPPGDPDAYYRVNVLGTLRLLEALRKIDRPCRVVLVGSAAELGPVPVEGLPVAESHPCQPADAYGLSKWLATCAGLATRPPIEVVIGRVFNLMGPGLPENQAFGRFAAHLARQPSEELVVGPTDTKRDFVDVRDVARALIILGRTRQATGVFHIGTGVSHSVGEGLDHLLKASGNRPPVRIDKGRFGNGGPSDSRADVTKLQAITGWKPEVSWGQSLDDLWSLARDRACCD